MCIIAYMNKGIQIKEDVLQKCFKVNPDGAGIMFKDSKTGKIEIIKGLMTFEDLKMVYYAIPVDCERAVHCRIATSGKISTSTCHPFPVRSRKEKMKNGNDQTTCAFMHNGIMSEFTPTDGMKSPYSDSMVFGAKVLFNIKNELKNKTVVDMLEKYTTGNRLCIMRSDADTILLGTWQESEGVKFSNGTFQDYTGYFGSMYGDYYKRTPINYGKSFSWKNPKTHFLCDKIPQEKTIKHEEYLYNTKIKVITRYQVEEYEEICKELEGTQFDEAVSQEMDNLAYDIADDLLSMGCEPDEDTLRFDENKNLEVEVYEIPQAEVLLGGYYWYEI